MAKAEPLTMDALKTPQITPKAATPARSPAPTAKAAAPKEAKVETVPLQIRVPRAKAKGIKMAATEREMTHSEFLLVCYEFFMEQNK